MRQCRIIIDLMPRKSKTSEVVFKIIERANRPMSSLDIQREAPEIDRATVYRALDNLRETAQIRIVEIGDGVVRYELTSDHHHHLICLRCKKTERIDLPEREEINLEKIQIDFQKKLNFTSLQHSLEFFGVCQKCQNGAR